MLAPLVSLVRLMSEAAMLVSLEGRVLFVNPAAREELELGDAPCDALDLHALVTVPPGELTEYLRACARSSELIERSFPSEPKSGHPAQLSFRGASLGDASPPLIFLTVARHGGERSKSPLASTGARGLQPELSGLRVLLVEDEVDAREVLTSTLGRRGADVKAVGSADEALAAVVAHPPDVLVSDIGMPFRDGYDLIRRVRALPREGGGLLPAAALTAYSTAEDRRKALLAGFDMHVPKPVDPAVLIAVVASLARIGAVRR